jgi:hypothetical protein
MFYNPLVLHDSTCYNKHMSITPTNEQAIKPLYKTLKNGAVYGYQEKRIVANPGGGISAFTSDTAKQAVIIREEERALKIANGMMDGTNTDSPGNALQAIVAVTADIAIDRKHPRVTEAQRMIYQLTGAMPDKQPSQPQAVGISEAALHDVRDMLAMVMQERARRDSLDVSPTCEPMPLQDDGTWEGAIDSTCVTLPDDASEQAGGDEDA